MIRIEYVRPSPKKHLVVKAKDLPGTGHRFYPEEEFVVDIKTWLIAGRPLIQDPMDMFPFGGNLNLSANAPNGTLYYDNKKNKVYMKMGGMMIEAWDVQT